MNLFLSSTPSSCKIRNIELMQDDNWTWIQVMQSFSSEFSKLIWVPYSKPKWMFSFPLKDRMGCPGNHINPCAQSKNEQTYALPITITKPWEIWSSLRFLFNVSSHVCWCNTTLKMLILSTLYGEQEKQTR